MNSDSGDDEAILRDDDPNFLILFSAGEVIKTGDLKSVLSEGMPTYRSPFEKGKLIIQFIVDFPESISPQVVPKLEKLLPPK